MKMTEERKPESTGEPSMTLEELFATLESPLLNYAIKLVQKPDIAQDIVQDAFLRLHQRLSDVRQPKSWLYRTVHNLAMSHHRKNRKMITSDFEDSEGFPEPSSTEDLPDERLVRMEAVGMAMLCLDRLKEDARELVHLKFVENLSYKEIAEHTGLSSGNVGYKLHHAIKFLARELKKEGILE
ncbi:MAG: RNA polymerase sigma factor [Opitutales bacterium]